MIAALEHGRDAVGRHAWVDAMASLSAADHDSPLAPDDLEQLGTAAWWAGQPDEATEALERAFVGHEAAGRVEDAARVASVLAYQAFRRLAAAVGMGWVAEAQRLLEGIPDSPIRAFLGVFQTIQALMEGRIEAGIELADQTMTLARQLGNDDARYSAMSIKGMAEIMAGRWQSGLALSDEAAAAASSGRLDLRSASDIYCQAIATCRNLGDLQRAAQWTEEAERWMRRQSVGGYPGICQVHRAELKMLHGQWPEAEQEARKACARIRALPPRNRDREACKCERDHVQDAAGRHRLDICSAGACEDRRHRPRKPVAPDEHSEDLGSHDRNHRPASGAM
jgi:hypothetical protein